MMVDTVRIRLLRAEGLKEGEVLDLEVDMPRMLHAGLRSGAVTQFEYRDKTYEFHGIVFEKREPIIELVPVVN